VSAKSIASISIILWLTQFSQYHIKGRFNGQPKFLGPDVIADSNHRGQVRVKTNEVEE
jgi:hypothetical protein